MPTGTQRVAVVIEDDPDIRHLLEAILGQAGFTCYAADSGPGGLEAIRTYDPILTTLDVSLPGIDGFEVARRIRSFSRTYIIMLSARDEEIDTLMGLDAGADDYLTKPFRPRELRARIEAMLRRYHRHDPAGSPATPVTRPGGGRAVTVSAGGGPRPDPGTSDAEPGAAAAPTAAGPAPPPAAEPSGGPDPAEDTAGWLSHNGLRINAEMWRCELDGVPLVLTRSEFDLLLALMSSRRRVVTKDALALELRGDYVNSSYVSDADRRAVEVHVANLRRKLSDPVSSPRYVETVRGVGYRLAEAR